MKNFEKYALPVISLLLVMLTNGCLPAVDVFSFKRDIKENPRFFQPIVDSAVRRRLMENVDTILVYKAVFREYQIENNNILDYTTINSSRINSFSDSAKYKIAWYKEFKGGWTEIYLFHLKSSSDPRDGFVYFSSKFHENDNEDSICFGFGPAYFGKISTRPGGDVIKFDQELETRERKSGYSLRKPRKLSFIKSGSLLFALDDRKDKVHLKVSKIVNTGKNKIGGDKSLVYEVTDVFSDPLALKFIYHTTIIMKP